VELTLHGETRLDEYAYLRDREHPETLPYLARENAYTDAMTAHTKPLEDTLYAEIVARIKEDDDSVPVKDGDWYYQSRTVKGKQYPVHLRRHGSLDAAEEVVLDENAEAEGLAYYELGGLAVSPDGRWLAVLEDTTGYEDFTLRIRDLRTGKWQADRIEKVSWGLAWANDNATLFYVTFDAAKRSDRVWRHTVGTPRAQDVCVHHEPDVTFNASVMRARSGEWLVLGSSSYTSAEWYVVPANAPAAEPRLVAARQPDVEYDVIPGAGWFYIHTNRDARNFQVMRAAFDAPAAWQPWLAHRAEVFVEDVMAFQRHLVVTERRDGLRRLVIHDLAAGTAHDVAFPEAAYGVFPTGNPEFGTDTVRFMYSSPVTPNSVFDYHMHTRTRALMKRDEVLGGYDASRYTVERTMATARDGTRVPVSMVYRTDFRRDGSRPLLLYAYGSYGYTLEPTFSAARFSLIDRGVTYAIAHIRGGQEMGRQWYDNGKMLRKMNTFTDFIDVAEHLVRERYTSAHRLLAHGGSAGGLLIGVVANLRPDLFRAVVADVPFVDVINTMLDASIPLTAQEWLQWGNPQVEEEYRYIRQYSPYDNVRAQSYPAMLVISGLYDPRVAFWEPTKWVAKLRAHKTDANVLLLRMQMTAGHGGGSGRYEQYREAAFRYAFMLDQVGITA
jgi:oligopeptidase B